MEKLDEDYVQMPDYALKSAGISGGNIIKLHVQIPFTSIITLAHGLGMFVIQIL